MKSINLLLHISGIKFYIQNNMNVSCSKIECYHIVTLTEPIMLTGIEKVLQTNLT